MPTDIFVFQLYVLRLRLVCTTLIFGAVAITSRAPVVLSEFMILITTWVKTFYRRQDLLHMRSSTSLTQCLLRDGMSKVWY